MIIEVFFLIMGGLMLSYAFPPHNFTIFLLFSLTPFVWWLYTKKTLILRLVGVTVFYLSFIIPLSSPIFILIFSSLYKYLSYSIIIIEILSLLIYFSIVFIYGLPFFIFSSINFKFFVDKGIIGLFLLSCIFPLLEYLFSLFLPYPYIIGYGAGINLFTKMVISYLGIAGLTFLIVFFNLLLFRFFALKEKRHLYILFFVIFAVLFLLPESKENKEEGVLLKVGIIQESLGFQKLDFFKELEIYIRDSLKTKNFSPDIVVWPESSVPIRLLRYPYIRDILAEVPKKLNSYLVFGTYGDAKDVGKYNQAMVFDNFGREKVTYSKIKIIPFFEGPPNKQYLKRKDYPFKDRNFVKGRDYKTFTLKSLKIGLLICSEILYPEIVRDIKKRGIDVLIVISNESLLSPVITSLLLKITRFRAIEEGLYIVRANSSGESGVISSRGNILALSPYGKKYVLTRAFFVSKSNTIYSKFGINLLIVAFLGFLLIFFLHNNRRSNKIYKNK